MKKNTLATIAAVFLLMLAIYYLMFGSGLKTFNVADLSQEESFEITRRKDIKPVNVDFQLVSHTDSAYRVHIVGIPSGAILFDSVFTTKEVGLFYKLDYYTGYGVRIVYSPGGAKTGWVQIKSRINADF